MKMMGKKNLLSLKLFSRVYFWKVKEQLSYYQGFLAFAAYVVFHEYLNQQGCARKRKESTIRLFPDPKRKSLERDKDRKEGRAVGCRLVRCGWSYDVKYYLPGAGESVFLKSNILCVLKLNSMGVHSRNF